MDAETSQRLEEAFLQGQKVLVLDGEEGWSWRYDLDRMEQTSMPPPGSDTPTTRKVQRVFDVSEV